MERDVELRSTGEICRGTFITPSGGRGPFSTVVMAGG